MGSHASGGDVMKSSYICECGEDIEQHEMRGPYLMCPDHIHEYEPRTICDVCRSGINRNDERAEVVRTAMEFTAEGTLISQPHLIVHEACYNRERMELA
jgi:Zn finger protein HypA/HybF involved in hydrogenase expression